MAGLQPLDIAGMSPRRIWAYIDFYNERALERAREAAASDGP